MHKSEKMSYEVFFQPYRINLLIELVIVFFSFIFHVCAHEIIKTRLRTAKKFNLITKKTTVLTYNALPPPCC
jgi:hypothetical protein